MAERGGTADGDDGDGGGGGGDGDGGVDGGGAVRQMLLLLLHADQNTFVLHFTVMKSLHIHSAL